MQLRHPVQKVCVLPSNATDQPVFLAASGPTISCVSIENGKPLFQWPSPHEIDDSDEQEANGGPPIKRRKLETNGRGQGSRQQSEASDASLEIVSERKKGERKKSKFIDTKLPNVSHLLATSDGKHIIAATAEDKAIRVFKTSSSGRLTLISDRSLPKKICALRLVKDENTILAADKFGDVYAVPLHQPEGWVRKKKADEDKQAFKPSATELTVHTKRNLESLRQQQEQKVAHTKKETPDFEHQLLLGHVSLLTDLAVAEGFVGGKARPFILTSDRDEHIRVSRGMPQAHIIETFCLGHREFATKLCIPTLRPTLLIAGNGETSLRLFDWQKGQLIQTIKIGPIVPDEYKTMAFDTKIGDNLDLPEGRSYEKLAVSGIWPVGFSQTRGPYGEDQCLVLVAIEGIPLILTYILSSDHLTLSESIELPGNVLDIAILNLTRQILVSIDTVHKPWSMKSYRDVSSAQESLFHMFELNDGGKQFDGANIKWRAVDQRFDSSDLVQSLPEAPQLTAEDESKNNSQYKIFSSLGEFLYGLENLRKKRDMTFDDLTLLEAHDTHSVPQKEEEEEADAAGFYVKEETSV